MNYSRRQYKYILNGNVNVNTPICDYRLVSQNHFPDDGNNPIISAIRFLVPNDMKIRKVKGCFYSMTKDTRLLHEIGAKLVVKMNGRWKESPFGMALGDHQPYNVMPTMMQNGYFVTPMGYMDRERYGFYVNEYVQSKRHPNDYVEFDKAYKKYKKMAGN